MIIVFEGIDGSGKGVQSKKLSARLTSLGMVNSLFSFPNYTGTIFGAEAGRYLNGGYGPMENLPPQFPSMLYALDRFEMKGFIETSLDAGNIVIFDRYVPSNFAHQAAKMPKNARRGFIDWVKRLEYNILGLPEPDVTVFLDAEPSVAGKMVLKKEPRNYTENKKDIHEIDAHYIEEVYKLYKTIAAEEGWLSVGSSSEGEMRPREDIFDDIRRGLRSYGLNI